MTTANITDIDLDLADTKSLNRQYLHFVRELARRDIGRAELATGLTRDLLAAIAQSPLDKIDRIAEGARGLLMGRPRFNTVWWEAALRETRDLGFVTSNLVASELSANALFG